MTHQNQNPNSTLNSSSQLKIRRNRQGQQACFQGQCSENCPLNILGSPEEVVKAIISISALGEEEVTLLKLLVENEKDKRDILRSVKSAIIGSSVIAILAILGNYILKLLGIASP